MSDARSHRWTYFIRGPDGIKIGQSGSPILRMATLQSAHGSELRLMLTVPYGRLSEPDAHEMFRHLKLNGEWFRARLVAYPLSVQAVRFRRGAYCSSRAPHVLLMINDSRTYTARFHTPP